MKYQRDFLMAEDEERLLTDIKALPFTEFEFRGFTGKRRTVSFGWRYDFNGGGLSNTDDMPKFLTGLRGRAEASPEALPAAFSRFLLPSMQAGPESAGTKTVLSFGDVAGISLLSACIFRLRRRKISGSSGRIFPLSRAPSICCAVLQEANGSTASRASKASAIQVRFVTCLKEGFRSGPRFHLAEKAAADAHDADRRAIR
jgi:hypothetical protein